MPTEASVIPSLQKPQLQRSSDMLTTFERLLYHHELQMKYLFQTYYDSQSHKDQLQRSISLLSQTLKAQNKIVLLGCGKSYVIASKVVATLRSVAIPAAILHPTEAMHGDMGLVQEGDALLFCSTSGETDEIIRFLDYAASSLAPSALQNAVKIGACAKPQSTIARMCDSLILLPQKHAESEIQERLKAPTLSTTSMLVILDCICISLSELYYDGDFSLRSHIFNLSHPGGGIGNPRNNGQATTTTTTTVSTYKQQDTTMHDNFGQLSTPLDEFNLLQTIVLYDWIQWNSCLIPSVILQKLYTEWKRREKLLERDSLQEFLERHLSDHI